MLQAAYRYERCRCSILLLMPARGDHRCRSGVVVPGAPDDAFCARRCRIFFFVSPRFSALFLMMFLFFRAFSRASTLMPFASAFGGAINICGALFSSATAQISAQRQRSAGACDAMRAQADTDAFCAAGSAAADGACAAAAQRGLRYAGAQRARYARRAPPRRYVQQRADPRCHLRPMLLPMID